MTARIDRVPRREIDLDGQAYTLTEPGRLGISAVSAPDGPDDA